jgi:hypothetical protein
MSIEAFQSQIKPELISVINTPALITESPIDWRTSLKKSVPRGYLLGDGDTPPTVCPDIDPHILTCTIVWRDQTKGEGWYVIDSASFTQINLNEFGKHVGMTEDEIRVWGQGLWVSPDGTGEYVTSPGKKISLPIHNGEVELSVSETDQRYIPISLPDVETAIAHSYLYDNEKLQQILIAERVAQQQEAQAAKSWREIGATAKKIAVGAGIGLTLGFAIGVIEYLRRRR